MRLFESDRITMVVAVFGAFLTIDMTLIKMIYYLTDKPIDKPIKNIKIIARYMLYQITANIHLKEYT